jgi:hypothetical protein
VNLSAHSASPLSIIVCAGAFLENPWLFTLLRDFSLQLNLQMELPMGFQVGPNVVYAGQLQMVKSDAAIRDKIVGRQWAVVENSEAEFFAVPHVRLFKGIYFIL